MPLQAGAEIHLPMSCRTACRPANGRLGSVNGVSGLAVCGSVARLGPVGVSVSGELSVGLGAASTPKRAGHRPGPCINGGWSVLWVACFGPRGQSQASAPPVW